MMERGLAHGAGVNLETIVFQHSRRGVLERMFAAKIGQHAFQALGATSRGYANGLRQQPDIALVLGAPDPFGHAHCPEHAPPTQRFFLRTLAEAFFCFNSSARVCSALPAQVSMVV